ncbi:MAG TPA: YbhB/YbcL family Raf kinase inhibitor-like protein [Candidatus Bilamarchaeum sp.]|nr:YbhB/YbcL family Raf kinase inhibitor-like protein [Candidatus Bilamarchaeum sp.]
MELKSAFENGREIPRQYTCDGDDRSPPLSISGVPPGAKSLAIIMDDPDAPAGTWVHWVVWNIDPKTSGIPEKAGPGVDGASSFGRPGYGGPCPPRGHGKHRYFFKAYALDCMLRLAPGSGKAELETAMKGHVLESAVLMGTYERRG